MSQQATVALRREELSRRVEALPTEVAGWTARSRNDLDMNAHFSQLEALDVFVGALVDKQRTLLAALDADAGGEPFRVTAFNLVREIIKTQRVWDFFRDKLELRFSPDFKDVLWVADTVAWDCYRPVMSRAVDAGIVPAAHVREPPLTYLTAEFSPATWVRGSRPNDGRDYHLGAATLPIPVIEVPWDHLGNLWELVSLQHEVGHDLEADLRLRPELLASLQQKLEAAGAPPERVTTWLAWEGEIFADLVGLQLGGPAFALGLMHLLLLPAAMVSTYDAGDPHPTHWVRVLMNAAYARTLVAGDQGVAAAADAIETTWNELYDAVPALQPYTTDFPHVFEGLMDTKLNVLMTKSVRELMPYTAADDQRIRQAAGYLETGNNAPGPRSMPPRHCVSAARLAAAALVEQALPGGGQPDGQLGDGLAAVNERLVELVRDQAAPGLRAAGESSTPHREFVAGFAERLPDGP
jgi:hypothetical protein